MEDCATLGMLISGINLKDGSMIKVVVLYSIMPLLGNSMSKVHDLMSTSKSYIKKNKCFALFYNNIFEKKKILYKAKTSTFH